MICAFGTAIDVLVFNGTRLVECAPYRDPERVQRHWSMTRRAADASGIVVDLRRRCYLTGYDAAERDRFLAAEQRARPTGTRSARRAPGARAFRARVPAWPTGAW